MARTLAYKTADGMVHIRLFDGRPGSTVFPGVTPAEAKAIISEGAEIVWGCFLDPGQTSKLCVRTLDGVGSYGNSHYLRWPTEEKPGFTWVPRIGRPIASAIALQ